MKPVVCRSLTHSLGRSKAGGGLPIKSTINYFLEYFDPYVRRVKSCERNTGQNNEKKNGNKQQQQQKQKKEINVSDSKVSPRYELGSLDSESRVLTITPWDL